MTDPELRGNLEHPVGKVGFAGKEDMAMQRSLLMVFPLLFVGLFAACSNSDPSPDVTESVHKSLDQAGYKDVQVSEDRDKGVVTLTGTVLTDSDKAQAESIAKSEAGSQVVANEIAVRPPGIESEAKAVDADLDKAIEKNAEAVLIKNRLRKDVKLDAKNGVLTLAGSVVSQSSRAEIEKLLTAVPNVRQVVNELEVKNQRATSTKAPSANRK
jgi:hyperosmotically inducible protein